MRGKGEWHGAGLAAAGEKSLWRGEMKYAMMAEKKGWEFF